MTETEIIRLWNQTVAEEISKANKRKDFEWVRFLVTQLI
jgi:hypothetical protein